MKIIKRGNKEDRPKQVDCTRCGSVLEYTSKDTENDWREGGKYIECPVCKENGRTQFITVN